MKTVFIDTGFDAYLSEKIKKGRIYDNVQEGLPKEEVRVQTLYKARERGKSLLTGFNMPSQQEEELRKALTVITRVIEDEKNKNRQAVVTEAELIAALDMLDEIAKERRQ